jgi:folate-binding protein YgfZ
MTAVLDRSLISVSGPDAPKYLQSMLTNDVERVVPGGGIYALLLTPKARIIADLEVFGVGEGSYVLGAPVEARDAVLQALLRSRFRSKVDLEPTDGGVAWRAEAGRATLDTPAGPETLVDSAAPAEPSPEWEVARVEAGQPRYLREFDGESMPAEAGVVDRAVSFTKGCYPGQEPVARLFYRGHANRGVRGLRLARAVDPGAEVTLGDKRVGRVTSPVESPRFGHIALAVLRQEVPDGAVLSAAGVEAFVVPLPFTKS